MAIVFESRERFRSRAVFKDTDYDAMLAGSPLEHMINFVQVY